jgi:hypothetical protein
MHRLEGSSPKRPVIGRHRTVDSGSLRGRNTLNGFQPELRDLGVTLKHSKPNRRPLHCLALGKVTSVQNLGATGQPDSRAVERARLRTLRPDAPQVPPGPGHHRAANTASACSSCEARLRPQLSGQVMRRPTWRQPPHARPLTPASPDDRTKQCQAASELRS